MATYRELLAQVKGEIDEVTTSDVLDRLVLEDDFIEFLTLPAYPLLDRM